MIYRTGAAAAIILVAGLIATANPLSVLNADTGTVVSYCGTPDWFQQFEDKEGYTPNARCTGVEIQGYRIDVGKSSYENGQWGCFTDYTVYKKQSNGEIKKVATGDGNNDIKLDGLTVNTKTGWNMKWYECNWVQTSYDVTIPGSLSINTSAPEKVERGKTASVKVTLSNRYNDAASGKISTEICGPGTFDKKQCTTKTREVNLRPGEYKTVEFQVDTQRLGDSLSASTSFDGVLKATSNWQGVNLDCDGDNVIEPVQNCNGLNLDGSGGKAEVDVTAPSVQTRLARLGNALEDKVLTLWMNLFGKQSP